MDEKTLSQFLEQILATAQAGLTYSTDRFDIERFRALQQATAALLATDTGQPVTRIQNWIDLDSHYPTPKLDVRALILDSNQHVLLVREASDGLWTLPGGWCDIGESPADAVVREVREETGLSVRPTRLLALLDKHKHAHPPQLPHALKAFFLCDSHGGELLQQTSETTAAGFYAPTALPELSTHRVLTEQIRYLYAQVAAGNMAAAFD
ncbi:NUDIX hydrolase [Chitiniphilus eburneus]|uniref:NUDIX domain-containing protein n=1 Tax=Chitiniphilus eburneus TaxID=2571148 RepID=A0A4U0PWD3_9NEIS|nr:NUDIX hydrolase [Chitiniphilus eburneus]TJZ67424.1 NUDIX domain-containing protein [Chitiniphilus eburneus]